MIFQKISVVKNLQFMENIEHNNETKMEQNQYDDWSYIDCGHLIVLD